MRIVGVGEDEPRDVSRDRREELFQSEVVRVRPRREERLVGEGGVDFIVPLLVEEMHLALDAGVLFAGGGELGGGERDDGVEWRSALVAFPPSPVVAVAVAVAVAVVAFAVASSRRRCPRPPSSAVLLLLLTAVAVLLMVRRMRREDEAGEGGSVVDVAVLALFIISWGVREEKEREGRR